MIKKLVRSVLAALLIAVFTAGCARQVEPERDAAFYKELGDKYKTDRKYKKSIKAYEDALMRAESPEIAAEIQLALADSYFFYKEYNDAIPVYETYLDVYSDLPSADLAYLRLGLSHYELINRPGRDQTDTLAAMDYFNKVKERNPGMYNDYALDEKMKSMRERLAEKELIVGKYYARIWKREPAILRYKYLLENYPDSKHYPEAAYRLVKLLVKEGRAGEAATYVTLLKMKLPDNSYTHKAEKLVNDN